MKKLGIALVGAATLVLAGCSASDTRIVDAGEECKDVTVNYNGVSVEDDGATLVFDMKGEDDKWGGDIDQLACVLNALDAPARVTESMSATRSLDGKQEESWDGISASWRYHPDTGLDALFFYTAK